MPSTSAHTFLELPPNSKVDPAFQQAVNDSFRQVAQQLDSISTGTGAKASTSTGSSTGTTVVASTGGQYSIQVEGYLAIQTNAAPPLVIDSTQTPIDMTAYLNEAPNGGPVVVQVYQGTTLYGTLTIPAGALQSNTITGPGSLTQGSRLSVNITNVPTASGTLPGRDLAVSIRL